MRCTLEGTALDGSRARVRLDRRPGPVRLNGALVSPDALSGTFRTTSLAGVGTVEHLLGALGGLGVFEGVVIEVEGRALPLLDGGAARYARALAGARAGAPSLRVKRPGAIDVEGARATFEVAPGIDLSVWVSGVPEPEARWMGDPADFEERVAPARTFAFADDVALERARFEVDPRAVMIVREGRVINGARDEPARHKLLDLIGDLYVWGGPPIGRARFERPGHRANHAIVREALARGLLG